MASSPLKQTLNLPETKFPMRANLSESEPRMLARWNQEGLYQRIRAARKGRPQFILHDGPPYANGAIHLGHALNKLLKDFIVKSHNMMGMDSPYVPGWDCHGLPIEIKVDQHLGAKKSGMPALSIRKACRDYAAKFVDLHRKEFKRLGIFGRWDDPYLTMNPQFEAVIAEKILEFVANGYAYKGLRAVYWCVHDRTALAEAEVEYENHTSPTVFVRYPWLKGTLPEALQGKANIFGLIWTTTPWTLPASVALSFHPDLDYVAVRVAGGEIYIAAEALLPNVTSKCGLQVEEIVARFPGKAMEGVIFRHPWLDREVPGVLADYVTTDQGTGIVHTAPGHGADDFATGERYGLPVISPVDNGGILRGPEAAPFEGLQVFDANPKIVEYLREIGALLGTEPIEHSYPHCWRCHNPIIFRATEQWFIGMEKNHLRERALEEIRKVRWIPEWGEERISNMIANRPDWCISRQRVWGVPIPVLACAQCHQYLRSAEVDQRIVETFRREGSDSWFAHPAEYFVPAGVACAQCGGTQFVQEKDIVDVWFESGSSQAAVLGHSPELPWPADLYLEGGDQYRGWFHSSLLVSVGTRGKAPYRQVLTHGWVLDADGRAMSKSLGNVIEPEEIVKKYGAEILRLWVASVEYRDDVRISDDMLVRLADAFRKIRNTFRYLLSNLAGFDPKVHAVPDDRLWELDRHMLREAARLARQCQAEFTDYAFHRAYRRLFDFFAVDLSAFYLDVLKDRLYTFAPDSEGRRSAQTVLWKIAELLVRLWAPLLPFTTEDVWAYMPATGLDDTARSGSIHLEEFIATEAWLGSEAEDQADRERWGKLMSARDEVLKVLEGARKDKQLGTGLEALIELSVPAADLELFQSCREQLPALFIVSQVAVKAGERLEAVVKPAPGSKCERCWNYLPSVGEDARYPTVCARCSKVLETIGYTPSEAGAGANVS